MDSSKENDRELEVIVNEIDLKASTTPSAKDIITLTRLGQFRFCIRFDFCVLC
jgi:hypothetical protein